MKYYDNFPDLFNAINDGNEAVGLADVTLTQENVTQLAEAIKKNTNLKTLYLLSTKIGDEGAKKLAAVIQDSKSLQNLNLYDNNIGAEGATALDDAIKANPNILYAQYNQLSPLVTQELERRIRDIKMLISKWKRCCKSILKPNKIEEFYNKKDAMKLVSEREGVKDSSYKINHDSNFEKFDQELHELKTKQDRKNQKTEQDSKSQEEKTKKDSNSKLRAGVIGVGTFALSMFLLNRMASVSPVANILLTTELKVQISATFTFVLMLIIEKNSNVKEASKNQI